MNFPANSLRIRLTVQATEMGRPFHWWQNLALQLSTLCSLRRIWMRSTPVPETLRSSGFC